MSQQLTNILLETGTNELELVEFMIYPKATPDKPRYYGINVAKVREIIKTPSIVTIPKTNENIEGIINLRGKIVPTINLAKWLKLDTDRPLSRVIITEFNQVVNGFLVNAVTRIHRISWNDVMQPEELTKGDEENCITSVVKIDEKLILILDFEKIIGDIFPDTYFKLDTIEVKETHVGKKVLIVEDSNLIRNMVHDTLKQGGYEVIEASNGSAAFDMLMNFHKKVINGEGNIHDYIDVIVTDLEMPLMDGSHLIKRLRELPEFHDIPVIVFSSMASEEIIRKVKEIGADTFISKPELPKLVQLVADFIDKRERE
jgi:two-component system chemotaxis response regulator CheV